MKVKVTPSSVELTGDARIIGKVEFLDDANAPSVHFR